MEGCHDEEDACRCCGPVEEDVGRVGIGESVMRLNKMDTIVVIFCCLKLCDSFL